MNPTIQHFKIGSTELLPIVQGGMGIGISAHRLASAVAREMVWVPSPVSIYVICMQICWQNLCVSPMKINTTV